MMYKHKHKKAPLQRGIYTYLLNCLPWPGRFLNGNFVSLLEWEQQSYNIRRTQQLRQTDWEEWLVLWQECDLTQDNQKAHVNGMLTNFTLLRANRLTSTERWNERQQHFSLLCNYQELMNKFTD